MLHRNVLPSGEAIDCVELPIYTVSHSKLRIGMAKKRMLDVVSIWRDRLINKELRMEL